MLINVLVYAIKKLYGRNANAIILHSLDKGIYIETNFELNANKITLNGVDINSDIKPEVSDEKSVKKDLTIDLDSL